MDEQILDSPTVEVIAVGENLLEKAVEIAEYIEKRVERTLDYQSPPSA